MEILFDYKLKTGRLKNYFLIILIFIVSVTKATERKDTLDYKSRDDPHRTQYPENTYRETWIPLPLLELSILIGFGI